MNTFSTSVKMAVDFAQNSMCAHPDCVNRITDFHHKLPNTKLFNKLYPRFIQSIFNCVGLCRSCHDGTARHFFRIHEKLVQAYEEYLEKLERGVHERQSQ